MPSLAHLHPDRRSGTLEGPTLVLAEAERRDCAITSVYVSRYTDPQLIRRLQEALPRTVAITEVAAAELNILAAGKKHGGVMAILHGPPPARGIADRVLLLTAWLAHTRDR